jgi:predicted nucleic acid-binding protein
VRYLVDANVLSEPTRPVPQLQVIDWLRRHERELVIDPIVLGEIRFGILLLPKSTRRRRLEDWFDAGVQRIQCVPWDAATGLQWAQLLASLRRSGRAMPIKDSFIAATALTHDLTVATRNRSDFEKAGVRVVDPFSREADRR